MKQEDMDRKVWPSGKFSAGAGFVQCLVAAGSGRDERASLSARTNDGHEGGSSGRARPGVHDLRCRHAVLLFAVLQGVLLQVRAQHQRSEREGEGWGGGARHSE